MKFVLLLVLALTLDLCYGHGYLARPAARNYISEVKPRECPYDSCGTAQVNYDRAGLSAGGPWIVYADCRWDEPGCYGKFGLCGDQWNVNPQPHLEGGHYSSGLVNGHYKIGQTIYITIAITANHKGYYNFTLYDHPDSHGKDDKTTRQLKFYELEQVNPNMEHTKCSYHTINPKYDWCEPAGVASNFYLEYKLPAGVKCNRCVLQWHYMTGNSPDANPEEFWNCADITISDDGPWFNNERTNDPTPDGGTTRTAFFSTSVGSGYTPSTFSSEEFKPVKEKLVCVQDGEYYLCKKAK